jgi:hypothetical protein
LATALFDLGFGRGGVFAVRGTEPIDVEPEIEVRVGTAADLDVIAALGHVALDHDVIRSTSTLRTRSHDRSGSATDFVQPATGCAVSLRIVKPSTPTRHTPQFR